MLSKSRVSTFLVLQLYIWSTKQLLGCIESYANNPLNGFQCTDDKYGFYANVTQGLCTWTCLTSQQCAALSYNPLYGTCLLASQPCVLASKHDEFMMMVFRKQEIVSCAVWVQDEAGVIPDRVLPPRDGCHVGKVSVNGDLLVGNANLPGQNWNTYIAYKGGNTQYPTEELLTIHPDCAMVPLQRWRCASPKSNRDGNVGKRTSSLQHPVLPCSRKPLGNWHIC